MLPDNAPVRTTEHFVARPRTSTHTIPSRAVAHQGQRRCTLAHTPTRPPNQPGVRNRPERGGCACSIGVRGRVLESIHKHHVVPHDRSIALPLTFRLAWHPAATFTTTVVASCATRFEIIDSIMHQQPTCACDCSLVPAPIPPQPLRAHARQDTSSDRRRGTRNQHCKRVF